MIPLNLWRFRKGLRFFLWLRNIFIQREEKNFSIILKSKGIELQKTKKGKILESHCFSYEQSQGLFDILKKQPSIPLSIFISPTDISCDTIDVSPLSFWDKKNLIHEKKSHLRDVTFQIKEHEKKLSFLSSAMNAEAKNFLTDIKDLPNAILEYDFYINHLMTDIPDKKESFILFECKGGYNLAFIKGGMVDLVRSFKKGDLCQEALATKTYLINHKKLSDQKNIPLYHENICLKDQKILQSLDFQVSELSTPSSQKIGTILDKSFIKQYVLGLFSFYKKPVFYTLLTGFCLLHTGLFIYTNQQRPQTQNSPQKILNMVAKTNFFPRMTHLKKNLGSTFNMKKVHYNLYSSSKFMMKAYGAYNKTVSRKAVDKKLKSYPFSQSRSMRKNHLFIHVRGH